MSLMLYWGEHDLAHVSARFGGGRVAGNNRAVTGTYLRVVIG